MSNFQLHPTTSITDSSKLSDYMTCPRMYFFRHVLGWRHQGLQHDLVFGEAVHAGLEVLYRHGFGRPFGPDHTRIVVALAYDAFLTCYRKTFSEETDDDYGAKSPYMAAEALEAYCNQYEREFERYEVLTIDSNKCIEVSGFVPLDKDSSLHFRQDVILRDLSNGRKFTLEHKTASRGGTIWAAQWDLSLQVGTYTHALYSLFPPEEVWGVRVNGLIFLKRGVEFERIPCEKTYPQMQVWHAMALEWLDGLLCNQYELRRRVAMHTNDQVFSLFPLNPNNCTKWNRVCAYHNFCTCWANPLQHLDEVPLGYEVDFWDPADRKKEKEKNDE